MKNNPAVYLFAIFGLLVISALAFPGYVQPGYVKPGLVTSASSGRQGAARARVMSRSKGAAAERAAAPAPDQIAELSLPGSKQESAKAGDQNHSFALNRATLSPSQETPTAAPQVIPMTGPVSLDVDLRTLPDIPQFEREEEEARLSRYPSIGGPAGIDDPLQSLRLPSLPTAMPTPLATFAGITSAESACGCLPPDTDGDVGNSHYIQAVNSRFKIINKAGTQLVAPTTYNSLFSAMGPTTPCGNNQNQGDAVVFYDHMADRWVISDFAFPAFPGVLFYQCFAVSKTSDPVAGGWWLYALQVDPANPTFLGDYPKFGVWPDGYYMSVNMFSNNTTFNGVRVYALPRNAMINGTGAPNPGAIAFTITPANLGDTYSLLPATFRSGIRPTVAGVTTPEYFMSIDSSATAGTIENEVYTWRFHADFTTPANSTFGVGVNHTPNATITVNNFVDAFTAAAGTNIVPQTGTAVLLDTLGDKLMYPLVYQNLAGVESIYASHTINNNQGGTGPTAIRWYQFNVTGSTIPATPTQQQTFNNAADGLWRFMPSINVDSQGNLAIGYAASSSATNPRISYAGRLIGDPPSTLAQGEALLIQGAGHQTNASGRWGDYSATFVDPADNCTFWHTNEYYPVTANASWNTRIGTFRFPGCILNPTAAPATISGRVTTADGLPLAGVTLQLSGAKSATAISDSNGAYNFAGVEIGGLYTVTPSLVNFEFSPANQSFSLLANKADAVFTASRTGGFSNPLDTAEFFVRQHYLDFLGREPDQSGLEFWSLQIRSCGGDSDCIQRRMINVSAAYVLSIEFMHTGRLVDGLYRASYGRRPLYAEFGPDSRSVARGVVVGQGDWLQELAANKRAFVTDWVGRAAFRAAYDGMSNAQFVDALVGHTGVSFSSEERNALVSSLGTGATRADVLQQIVEDERFVAAKRNEMFVMMEYFGYLRRDPDEAGYRFWLDKLNQFNGNFEQAEMVKAFIVSGEYRSRFGQ